MPEASIAFVETDTLPRIVLTPKDRFTAAVIDPSGMSAKLYFIHDGAPAVEKVMELEGSTFVYQFLADDLVGAGTVNYQTVISSGGKDTTSKERSFVVERSIKELIP